VPAPTPTERPADPAAQTPVVAAPGASSPSTTSDSVWGAPAMDTRGSLRITTDPPGAQVFVNDDPRGRAPVTVELPYGKHRVRAVQSSYRTEVADVNLNVREMSVPLRLQPELKQGQVSIFGPAGSNVYVDSHDAGPVPVTVFAAEGVRTFRLKQSDGKECTTTQEVRFAAAGKAVLVNLAPCP
jgi:hypothetical protein